MSPYRLGPSQKGTFRTLLPLEPKPRPTGRLRAATLVSCTSILALAAACGISCVLVDDRTIHDPTIIPTIKSLS